MRSERWRRAMRGAAVNVIAVLFRVMPPGGASVVLSFPTVEDQGIAVAEELRRLGLPVTYLVPGRVQGSTLVRQLMNQGIKVASVSSPRGFWAYLRASRVFHTHGMPGNPVPPPRRFVVNLWHGMPIKRIRADIGGEGIPATGTPATSEVFVPVLASAFRVEREKVWVTGLPRNDRLLRAAAGRSGKGSPLVLWLPTYRGSRIPHMAADGEVTGSPVHIEGVNLRDIDAMSARLGVRCIVKLHPMASRSARHAYEHVQLVDDAWLMERGLSLYQLMATADLLVTDVSSAWVDYLLLDRPIVFCMADRDLYASGRGFYATESLMVDAGPFTESLVEVESWVSRILSGVDPYRDGRRCAMNQCHVHQDDGSTVRLLARVADAGDSELGIALRRVEGAVRPGSGM